MHMYGTPHSHTHSHNHHPQHGIRQRRLDQARDLDYEGFEQANYEEDPSYRLTNSTASEGDDSDDEDSSGACVWKLTFSDSIYDDALLRPLVNRGHEDKWHRCVNPINIGTMLFFNVILQCLVLWKIDYVSKEEKAKGKPLFEACMNRPSGYMPFLMHRPGTLDTYVDCSPLMVSMMSDVNNLDVNKDGFWTADEAAGVGPEWSATYNKQSDVPSVFKIFMNRVEKGELAAQQGFASAVETLNFTRIPMTWMQAQQGELQMCANFNPNLCGNLEVRGILANLMQYLGKDAPTTANSRIKQCKKLVEHCEDMFGQLYLWYGQVAHEACGRRESEFSNTSIVTTRYYNPITYALQQGAIAHMSYATFLCVIVTIWLLVVISEARQILCWWIVIIFYPTPSASNKVIAKDEDGNLDVLAMPNHYKVLELVFNLLPRTIICAFLAFEGCDFLIFADDYGDLILNSVALGFLIDIDNMIFRGVVTERHQNNVDKCSPMEVKFNCCWPTCIACINAVPQTMFFMSLIICISVTKIWLSYHESRGKYEMADAYTCLCHAEGENCVAAQVLGGLFNLPASAFAG